MGKKKKRILPLLLAIALCMTSILPHNTANAEEIPQNTSDLIFNIYGEGEVKVVTANNEEYILTEGSKIITLPVHSYVHVYATSTDGDAVSMDITTEDGIKIEDPSRYDEKTLRRDITVSDINKVIDIVLGVNVPEVALFAARNSGTEDAPEVGDVYSGSCSVADVSFNSSGGSVTGVKLGSFSGILSDAGKISADCADHGAAAPYEGQDFNYTYTVTSVNKSSGKVTGRIYAKAKLYSATDESMQQPSNKGYQRVAGTYVMYGNYPQDGHLKLTKSSANTSITKDNSNYSLSNAKYSVYSNKALTSKVGTLTTTAKGESNTLTLDAGTYYVKEATAPKGYVLDTEVYTVTVQAEKTTNLKVKDTPLTGAIILKKTSSNEDLTDKNSNYSLEGAKYSVYKDAALSTKAGTLTTNEKGTTNTLSGLAIGTYYVKEVTAPKGYQTDTTVHKVNVTANKTTTLSVSDVPYTGSIKVTKSSANESLTDDNNCYSLEGATYTIYKDANLKTAVGSITTKKTGVSDTLSKLPLGTYYVKETKAPAGYQLSDAITKAVVTKDGTTNVAVSDVAYSDPVGILLKKVDGETNKNTPQGAASLAGAEFLVKFYAGSYKDGIDPGTDGVIPTRSWVLSTNENGYCRLAEDYKVSGDAFYYMSNGDVTLPLGTMTIQEIKAPEGYLLNDEIFVRTIRMNENLTGVVTYNAPIVKEDIIRGDIEIVKVVNEKTADGTLMPLEGVTFHIRSKTTNEIVMSIVTDKDGKATTYDSKNKRAGLPFDTYIIEEDASTTPAGVNVTEPITCTTSTNGQTLFYIIENEHIISPVRVLKVDAESKLPIAVSGVEFRLLDSKKELVTMKSYYPRTMTHTSFTTDDSGCFTFPDKLAFGTYYLEEVKAPLGYVKGALLSFEVNETNDWENPIVVTYENVPVKGAIKILKTDAKTNAVLKGAEFDIIAKEDVITLDGTLRHRAGEVVSHVTTNEKGVAVCEGLYLNKDGKATYVVKEVKQPTGYILNDTTWDVTLEYKDQNTPIVTATLEVINEPTTLRIKKIDTESKKTLDGVTFTVWDDTSPDVKKDYNTNKDGVIEILHLAPGTYHFCETATKPGYMLDETIYTFTVTEDGRIDGKDVGNYEVLNIPTKLMGTMAKDELTDSNFSIARDTCTLIDTVKFKDLCIGETYTLIGTLMDKESGDPLLINGEKVMAEKTFIPTERDGSVDVVFVFDASSLRGKEVVVFESVYIGDVEILSHKDLEDEGQTIIFPDSKISTTAKDSVTGTNEAIAKNEATIIDTVTYENLIPDLTYQVNGILMDKETGEPLLINGCEVTAKESFTPSKPNGGIDLTFTFDASSLAGKSIVVFETLTCFDMEVASHKDLEDEAQTITYPKVLIGTMATDKADGDKEIMPSKKATIIDTVELHGLIVGCEYTLSGILMDKKSGTSLLIDNKEVLVAHSFTATEKDMEVPVTFIFDASTLEGKDLVAFETLTCQDVKIASHEDINDEGQTVSVSVIKKGIQTGVDNKVFPYLALGILPLAVIFGIVVRRIKTSK